MFKFSYLFVFGIILMSGCTKIEGTGGTSALRGKVTGTELASMGKAEQTDVICTNGASLEHGDYWLLNSSNTAKYYYIYYVNPTWISDPDPHLAGRIGVAVSFNYSDSNLEIAQKTQTALASITGAPFTVTRAQDILHIVHSTFAVVPDADNGTTTFAVDVVEQGEPSGAQTTAAAGDQRVYIVYGQNAYYSNTVRTNELGEFSFEGLQNGSYKVYVLGNDPQHPNASIKVEKSAKIDANESITDLGEFQIYF
jgi:hypothetical protein